MNRVFIAGIALSLLGTTVPSAHATFPGDNGRIVVLAKSEVREDVPGYRYVSVRSDWTDRRELGFFRGWDLSISPDQDWVSYSGSTAGGETRGIWKARIDGSGASLLTTKPAAPDFSSDVWPSWSSDGSRILFIRERGTPPYTSRLMTVDRDGSGLEQLTDGAFLDMYAKWSPRSDLIAFVRCSDVNRHLFFTSSPLALVCEGADIYVITSGGGTPRLLGGPTERSEAHLDWSPDGSRIAFTCDGDTTNQNDGRGGICVMNVATEAVRRIYASRNRGMFPHWSPDGKLIYFTVTPRTEEDADSEIFSIRRDGTGLRQITDNKRDQRPIRGWLAR
ncbi:MAG TPA: hypothetical protein VG929_01610 [Actinomycetota bacterium]|nr:hypothetical protein [Actinomycetota bacterium]